MENRWGVGRFSKSDEVIHLDQFAVLIPYIKSSEIKGIIPVISVYLANDLVLLSIFDKITKPPSTQSKLQCIADIKHRYAQFIGLDPINAHLKFRLIEFEIDIKSLEDLLFETSSRNRGTFSFSFSKFRFCKTNCTGNDPRPPKPIEIVCSWIAKAFTFVYLRNILCHLLCDLDLASFSLSLASINPMLIKEALLPPPPNPGANASTTPFSGIESNSICAIS